MSRKIFGSLTAVVLCITVLGACHREREGMPGANVRAMSLPPRIVSPQIGLVRAWMGEDISAFEPFFAEHAIVETPNGRFTGWTEIRNRWIEPLLPNISNFSATPTIVKEEGGDIIENGRYSYKITENGQTRTVRGTYAHRWSEMPDGSWRIVSAIMD